MCYYNNHVNTSVYNLPHSALVIDSRYHTIILYYVGVLCQDFNARALQKRYDKGAIKKIIII